MIGIFNISCLGEAMMDIRLLDAAQKGNANTFRELLNTAHSSINVDPVQQKGCGCRQWYCYEQEAGTTQITRRSDAPLTDSSDVTSDASSTRSVTPEGDGVLHIAAGFGHKELTQAILEVHNRDLLLWLLQQGNNRGDRPLHRAVRSGKPCADLDKAQSIMEASVFITSVMRAKNLDGQTCLHEAVLLGHKDVVDYLVSKDTGLTKIVDKEGVSPLYLATTLRRHDMVAELIRFESTSYSGPKGKTALHAALWSKGNTNLSLT